MLHSLRDCGTMVGMKTTKTNHIGVRLEDDVLASLDKLCAQVGGASRSRVLRRLLQFVESDPSDRYTDLAGYPVENNHHRRDFLDWFRRLDDALIKGLSDAIASKVRNA